MTERLIMLQPDDFHVHFRSGQALKAVVPHTAAQMARALVMPNLKPPVTQVAQALAYRDEIMAAVPNGVAFEPLMCLYLTDKTDVQTVKDAKQSGVVAFKLYPAGATTNSDSGVTDLFALLPVLEAMAEVGILLLVHGEVTHSDVDIFDREAVFIDEVLLPIMQKVPTLKIVFEHITTSEAAQLVQEAGDYLAATVTPQHLLHNRNDMLVGGVRPHLYCLPILKRRTHQEALLTAVSGDKAHKFFLGTDSAPHEQGTKECACGCAGVFSAMTAMQLYAQAFESVNALGKLEAFASKNGAAFYGLPQNTRQIILEKRPQAVPEYIDYVSGRLIPMQAGQALDWTFVGLVD